MCAVLTHPKVETERLVLRPALPDDAVYIADRINDFDIARMGTQIPYPYGIEDAQTFLMNRVKADPVRDRLFLIEHRAHGLAGAIGFHEAPTQWSETGCAMSPEMGYWLARSFWGRGLATEAVTAALDWARDAWGLRAVSAGHFADNPQSGRVLEKAGFLYTGEVQHRFSLARGEPAPTRMMVWLA
jgi:RimJ/RimL family protein N-acetyltransferase